MANYDSVIRERVRALEHWL